MTILRLSDVPLVLLGSALTLAAQDPSHLMNQDPSGEPAASESVPGHAELPAMRVPIHTAPADGDQGYGVWAGGPGYKVAFHGDMTFVPYLGRDYPENQPWSWRTTSATVGGVELATGTPQREQSDYRYEYRFAGITEAYDVRLDGLEQTFVVDQLPGGGDLVITGQITTALAAADVAPDHQALTFRDSKGAPITSYGAAVAFDAVGNTVLVDTGLVGDRVTLCVPGAWLAGATLPVVVDPLLARVQTAVSGGELGIIDIGRDDFAANDNVLFAYVRYASAADADVLARITNDDYSNTTIVYSDQTTTWSSEHVSCAFVGGANHWVIGLSRYFGAAPQPYRGVRCHAHASADRVLDTGYRSLARPAGTSHSRPDVGGVEAFASGDEALVVFQVDDHSGQAFVNTPTSATHGVLFEPALGSDGTFGQSFVISAGLTLDVERPAVNKVAEGGNAFSWVCAQQVYNNSLAGDDWDVVIRRIDNTGTVASGNWTSDFNAQNQYHQLGPVVEGQNGRYAVTFATVSLSHTPFKTGLTLGTWGRIERFDWPHGWNSPTILNFAPESIGPGTSDRRWQVSGLGYDTRDESHWVVTFLSTGTNGTGSAYYSRVGYNGVPTEAYEVVSGGSNGRVPSIGCVFDNDHDEFMFGFGTDESPDPVYGQTLTYDAVPPDVMTGNGCSSTTLSWLGNQQIGSEFNYLRAISAAPVGHFMIASLASHDVPIVNPAVTPGCRLLVDAFGPGYLATLPFQFGTNVRYDVALPEFLGPMTFYFQDWTFDGSVFEGSQRLQVQVVK